jgi:hypothetical protein
MVRAPKRGSQDRLLGRWRHPAVEDGGRISAVFANHRLRRLALCLSLTGASLLSVVSVSVSQNATPSLPVPDARMQAPVGHRQPRPSDLPAGVQRDEQLGSQSAEIPPPAETPPPPRAPTQKRTPNRGARAANVPTVDIQKSCQMAEKDIASILGPNNGITAGNCLKQEQDARQQIIDKWTTFPAEDRQKCINTTAYLPSYVEWITCLEMYRDVKNLDTATKGAGALTR